MLKVPTLDLKQQYEQHKTEIDTAIQEVIDTTDFILGDAVQAFEQSFAEFCNVSECVGVNSGTAALHLAYDALGIGPGDEVITSPFTFIATAEPILHLGAKPVFADIDPDSYNIDPDRVAERITDQTKAIVAVDLYGQPADMDRLNSIADEHDLVLIEDASQAHGARWKDKPAGSLADVSTFSFYPGKNLGAFGDAGAVTTDDHELAERIRGLRDHGRDDHYSHGSQGYNERMDGIQGAVLDVKLEYLPDWNEGRRQHADFYNQALESTVFETPTKIPATTHIYHQYAVRTPRRDQILEYLQDNDIGAGVHYPQALHLQPSLQDLDYTRGDLPVAESAADEVLSLPVFAGLTEQQLDYVVDQLKTAADKFLTGSQV